MATRKQVSANRRNALKSTGPTTQTGKHKVSQNALVHGLRAQVTVLPGEDQKQYEQLADLLRSQYQPQSGFEASLVERIIHCLWRLHRTPQIEVGMFLAEQLKDIEHPSYIVEGKKSKSVEFQNDANASHPGALDLARTYNRIAGLYRYEAQLEKLLRTNLELLERLQYVRKSGMDSDYLSKGKSFPAPSPASSQGKTFACPDPPPLIGPIRVSTKESVQAPRQPDRLKPISAKQSQFPGSASKVNSLQGLGSAKKKVA